MASSNKCGFLSCIYFVEMKNSSEFLSFTQEQARNDMPLVKWRKKYKIERHAVMNKVNYINRGINGEMETFKSYFSMENFSKLPSAERCNHIFNNCSECATLHISFLKLRRLKGESVTPTSDSSQMSEESTPEPQQPSNSSTTCKLPLKRKADNIEGVKKRVRRQIIKSARDTITDKLAEKDFVALYSSQQSENEWQKQRKDSFGTLRKSLHKLKSHTGSLYNYKYDFCKFISVIQESDLASINWSQLSKDVGLQNKNSLWPQNGGQVSYYIILISSILTLQSLVVLL